MPAPEVPLLRARRAAQMQVSAYLAMAVVALLGAAVTARSEHTDWIQPGLISPLVIAVLITAYGRPRRRVRGAPGERPAEGRPASDAEAARVSRALFALLAGGALFAGIVGGDFVLVVAAIGVAQVLALSVLRLRLARLERQLGVPLYQRLSGRIWREPLYPWVAADAADPALQPTGARLPTGP